MDTTPYFWKVADDPKDPSTDEVEARAYFHEVSQNPKQKQTHKVPVERICIETDQKKTFASIQEASESIDVKTYIDPTQIRMRMMDGNAYNGYFWREPSDAVESSSWSEEEEKLLSTLANSKNETWDALAKKHFPGRTGSQLSIKVSRMKTKENKTAVWIASGIDENELCDAVDYALSHSGNMEEPVDENEVLAIVTAVSASAYSHQCHQQPPPAPPSSAMVSSTVGAAEGPLTDDDMLQFLKSGKRSLLSESKNTWTLEEEIRLVEIMKSGAIPRSTGGFENLAKTHFPSYSGSQCMGKFHSLRRSCSSFMGGIPFGLPGWTRKENSILIEAHQGHSLKKKKDFWPDIAALFPGKDEKACREQFGKIASTGGNGYTHKTLEELLQQQEPIASMWKEAHHNVTNQTIHGTPSTLLVPPSQIDQSPGPIDPTSQYASVNVDVATLTTLLQKRQQPQQQQELNRRSGRASSEVPFTEDEIGKDVVQQVYPSDVIPTDINHTVTPSPALGAAETAARSASAIAYPQATGISQAAGIGPAHMMANFSSASASPIPVQFTTYRAEAKPALAPAPAPPVPGPQVVGVANSPSLSALASVSPSFSPSASLTFRPGGPGSAFGSEIGSDNEEEEAILPVVAL